MINIDERFQKITEQITNLGIEEQSKVLYFLLDATQDMLKRPNINKADVLLTYEMAVKYFDSKR